VSEQPGRCRLQAKVYIFDEQVSGDDGLASRVLTDDGGIIANPYRK
jgi:hypothetical protein